MKKNIYKFRSRFTALLCALVVAVSCMGVVPYYASESSDFSDLNMDIIKEHQKGADVPDCDFETLSNMFFSTMNYSTYSDTYKYYLIYYNYSSNEFCIYLSSEPMYFALEVDGTDFYLTGRASCSSLWGKAYLNDEGVLVTQDKYYRSTSSLVWYGEDLDGSGYISKFYTCFLYSNYDITVGYDSDYILFHSPDCSLSSEKYNATLGYLQNVNVKQLMINGDTNRTQTKYKFTFDTTSTTGIDLTSGEYNVRVYEQTTIYKDGLWQPFDTPRVLIGEYPANSGSLEFNIAEAMSKCDAATGDIEGYDMLSIALNNFIRADIYWLEIYNPTTGEHGGFVKLERDPDNGLITSTTVKGDDGYTEDMNGYIDDFVDTNIGEGTNFDDAELNADKSDAELDGFDEFAESLNDMTATVSAIPKIIGSLFSFLPPWCLWLCGASFGFTLLLIVLKTAR